MKTMLSPTIQYWSERTMAGNRSKGKPQWKTGKAEGTS